MAKEWNDLFEHVTLHVNFERVDAEDNVVRSAALLWDIQYWYLRSDTNDLDTDLLDVETVASNVQLYFTNHGLTSVVRGFFHNDSECRQAQVVVLVREFKCQDLAQGSKAELDVQSGGTELIRMVIEWNWRKIFLDYVQESMDRS